MNPLPSDPTTVDDRAPESPAPSEADAAEVAGASDVRDEERSPTLWRADGWTARIIKNEDDDGWAVEMTRDGETEPALVGPWTMGRDKKNPKPIDAYGYAVLVKTANEVRARHAQQLHAQLHRSVNVVSADGERLRVDCDVVPDDDDPHAVVSVRDRSGALLSSARVSAGFKLTTSSAQRWIEGQREA